MPRTWSHGDKISALVAQNEDAIEGYLFKAAA